MALLNLLKGSAVARLTVYDLSVIPLFLLMGQFATQGGLSRALFKAAAAFVGHVRGGLAMAAICRRRLRRGVRVQRGDLGHHHPGGLPGDEGAWLPRAPDHRGAGRRRHAGHPDPALGAAWSSTRS